MFDPLPLLRRRLAERRGLAERRRRVAEGAEPAGSRADPPTDPPPDPPPPTSGTRPLRA